MLFQTLAWWCFEMHGGAIHAAGDHLHRFIAAQLADTDMPRVEVFFLNGEQPLMPVQQTGEIKRGGKVLGGIEHQVRQPFAALAGPTCINVFQAKASSQ
ncbi:hypothetical protein D3C84_860700 [compost metagenome]